MVKEIGGVGSEVYVPPMPLKENDRKAHGTTGVTTTIVAACALAILATGVGVGLLIAGGLIPNPVFIVAGLSIISVVACTCLGIELTACIYRFVHPKKP